MKAQLADIAVVCCDVKLRVKLDEKSTLAGVLTSRLPVSSVIRLWGGEAYIGGISGLDDIDMDGAVEWVEPGTVALWPDGRALSLFVGPTPVSVDERIRTAGRVFPVGRIIDGDINLFSCLEDGEMVEIKKLTVSLGA